MNTARPAKPLGAKAYGSIPHLPGSRMGPADHHCHEGQARIATARPRKGDVVIVQEKLDGSCVSVAKVDGTIHALGRAGYPAATSPYEQHHLFARWVEREADRFDHLLADGERVVGEWLAQVHGTRYDLRGSAPFVAFDIMAGKRRATHEEAMGRLLAAGLPVPYLVAKSPDGVPLLEALAGLGFFGHHGALDPVEGVVYRVERNDAVDFLVKFVFPDKVDGRYLPEVSGAGPVWNWTEP